MNPLPLKPPERTQATNRHHPLRSLLPETQPATTLLRVAFNPTHITSLFLPAARRKEPAALAAAREAAKPSESLFTRRTQPDQAITRLPPHHPTVHEPPPSFSVAFVAARQTTEPPPLLSLSSSSREQPGHPFFRSFLPLLDEPNTFGSYLLADHANPSFGSSSRRNKPADLRVVSARQKPTKSHPRVSYFSN